jgi:hypothetical protein
MIFVTDYIGQVLPINERKERATNPPLLFHNRNEFRNPIAFLGMMINSYRREKSGTVHLLCNPN